MCPTFVEFFKKRRDIWWEQQKNLLQIALDSKS